MEQAEYFDNNDDEYMDFGSHSIRPRFKDGLNMQKLMSGGTSFEIDTEEGGEFLEDLDPLDDPSFAELFKETVIEKKNGHLQNLFNVLAIDDVCGDYDGLAEKMEVVSEDGGVKKLIVQEGTGNIVPDTSKVFVHYVAICENNDEPYDSTLARGIPLSFNLAAADMIPGLFLALTSMKIGEISKFLLRSDYAYGECGIPPRVPPNTRLLFTIELIDATSQDKLGIHHKTTEERALLSFPEICKEAEILRINGNAMYGESRFHLAIRSYRDAIRILEDYPVVNEDNEKSRNELLFTLYINLGQCYLKLEKGPQACVACRMALRFDKESRGKQYKAYFRFARAKFLLSDYEEAKKLCERALKLEPRMKCIGNFLKKIDAKIREDDINTKRLYKTMAGGAAEGANAAESISSSSNADE